MIDASLAGNGRVATIREEITQALGLFHYGDDFPSGTFYEPRNMPTTFADVDEFILRSHYDVRLVPRMTRAEVHAALEWFSPLPGPPLDVRQVRQLVGQHVRQLVSVHGRHPRGRGRNDTNAGASTMVLRINRPYRRGRSLATPSDASTSNRSTGTPSVSTMSSPPFPIPRTRPVVRSRTITFG